MNFRFPLESVLNLRRGQEHGERRRLATLVQKLSRVDRLIETLAQQRAAAREELARVLSKGLSGAEFRFQADLESRQVIQWNQLLGQRTELEQQVEAQRETLKKARRQRDVIESLFERQHEAYLAEQNRREQRESDELFLLNREPRSNG